MYTNASEIGTLIIAERRIIFGNCLQIDLRYRCLMAVPMAVSLTIDDH